MLSYCRRRPTNVYIIVKIHEKKEEENRVAAIRRAFTPIASYVLHAAICSLSFPLLL